jgi:hypothetical protein
MNKKFIERHLPKIKQLLISNGYVNENWEIGEIDIAMSKWGYFKNDFFRISFYSKWVWENEFGSKNCNNIGGRMVYWSYNKSDESGFDVKYLIGRDSNFGIKDEWTINYWLDKGVIPEPFPR